MKKFLSFICAAVIIISLVPCAYAVTGRYIVTAEYADVRKSPNITSEKIAEVPKNTYVEITEVRSTNFGKAYIAKDGITGWIFMNDLAPAFTEAPESDIREIVIKSYPEKTTYTDGLEELDLTGLSVYSVDKKGKEELITAYNVFTPEMRGPGTKTVKISYTADKINYFYTSFTVEVVRVPVKSLSVETLPVVSYKEHAVLDLSGLRLTTVFDDPGMNRTLTFDEIKDDPDYIISSCHNEHHGSVLQKGTHTIRINYKYQDIFAEFNIEVIPRKLVSLEVKNQPSSLVTYDKTVKPSIDGLILTAYYDNGEVEDIPHYNCLIECDPSQFAIGPGNEVKVYFGELFVTLDFTYSGTKPQGIKVATPASLLFLKGEEIDLSDIKVYLEFTDGSTQEVTDFTMSRVDYTREGTQNIVVRYKEYSEVFSIIISPIFSKGDVNGDGKVTAGDARSVLRVSVGFSSLSGMTFFAGDTDRNDKITANDARLILRASVGLENLYITLK